ASPNLESVFKITAIGRRRVHESVADQIRQAIFGGLLAPGHKLPPEREMAKRFQTSRVALREALRTLEKEGMINIKAGYRGGAGVRNFTPEWPKLLTTRSYKLWPMPSINQFEILFPAPS